MKILFSIPNQMWIHKYVSMAIHRICSDPRHEVTVIWPTHRPYENNLCQIVNDFMAGDYDYWLNMDDDNPPIGNPLDLIEFDKDVIGLPTPVVRLEKGMLPVYENAYKLDPPAYRPFPIHDGLQEVDATGTGCFLTHRRVFEKPEMRIAPFRRTINRDGTVAKGPDIYFCEKAKSNGFKIWVHFDYPCRHFHEVDIRELAAAFRGVNNG